MIRIQQLKLKIPHTNEQLKSAVKKTLHLKKESFDYWIVRQSLDARKKPELFFVYTVDVKIKNNTVSEHKLIAGSKNKNVCKAVEQTYNFPKPGNEQLKNRPVIIGSGPAGMFCGLLLARHGYRPILLERGRQVELRQKDVQDFWEGGKLNPESNVQFGEGGAGTFSDGKLNTLVKDSMGRNRKVLEEFVNAGADPKILYQQKPHIGTDVLKHVIQNMRKELIAHGGEVRFEAKVTGLSIECGRLKEVIVNGSERFAADVAVLAIGHSARDTFAMLETLGVPMQAKSFAVGVRVEHPQNQINFSQYGMDKMEYLEAADYKLTAKAQNGRGVYSFCMCPGGYVVNASSEEGRLAVNGMSYSGRDGENANSAIIVTVNPEDFPDNGVLAGVEFQRKLEEQAYKQGRGKIPVQLYKDFKKNICSEKFEGVYPNMKGQYCFSNVRAIFPPFIGDSIEDGMEQFGRKIKDFARGDCLLSGVESRTSSPVRILRDEEMQSEIQGLYPCGEGAGYAGGITSAAMDGIRVAEAIASRYFVEEDIS